MRPYPTNSPQAAARIVALTLFADGQASRSELVALDRLEVHQRLGLDRAALRTVIHELCADLLDEQHQSRPDVCRVTPRSIDTMMAEIDIPALRRTVLTLCIEVAEADGRVADGEAAVLVAAVEQWGLQREMVVAGGDDGALDTPSHARDPSSSGQQSRPTAERSGLFTV